MPKKKGKKKSSRPKLPPVVLLRPNLFSLFQEEMGEDEQKARLDRVMKGIKLDQSLPVLLGLLVEDEALLEAWQPSVLAWLKEEGREASLFALLDEEKLPGTLVPLTKEWLGELGVEDDLLDELKDADYFHGAFSLDNGSQGVLMLMYYTNKRKKRVRGLGFLFDHHAPWFGACKDIISQPAGAPEHYIEEVKRMWEKQMPVGLVDCEKEEAQELLFKLLSANKNNNLRLPREFNNYWRTFATRIWPILTEAGFSELTLEDLEKMLTEGRSVEQLREQEQLGAGFPFF